MTVVAVVMLVSVFLVLVTPVYVIGQRRGLRHPWAAFVPLLGVWIVLLESMGRNGWLALLVLIPYVGWLLLLIWTAAEIPPRHGRSRWWTLAFIVPGLNLLAYWFYAFTLPREPRDQFAFAS